MKYVLLYLLTFISLSASAQTDTVYLNSKGVAVNNSKKAKSYAVRQKLEDSAYFIRQYDMSDSILIKGTYKDAQMTVPHGRFTYYFYSILKTNIDLRFVDSRSHNPNYVQTTGYYLDGIKNGVWIKYSKKGEKLTLTTYSNGKKNGLYQDYDWKGILVGEGNYDNDVKDGNWCTVDIDSTVIEYGVFKNDKKIKSDTIFMMPQFKNSFYEYLLKKAKPYYAQKRIDSLDAIFVVDTEGKISDPKICQEVVSNVEEELKGILTTAPKIRPAYYNHLVRAQMIYLKLRFNYNKYNGLIGCSFIVGRVVKELDDIINYSTTIITQ